MADMRQILTYPNNVGTDYIDPNYIGNATSGLTRRIDELLAGTYKAWLNPLSITATTSEVMQNISKFGSYYENQSYAGHLSRYDFWNKPLVVATKKLIDSETILLGNAHVNPLLITTTTPHEFEDGLKILTSGVDGTLGAAINSNTYENLYAKVISSTEIQLATDEALTDLVGFIGGVTNYTLPADNGLMMHWDNPTHCCWTPSGINLSSMLSGTATLTISDGQAITINSSVPVNSGLSNVTWYLKNTASSATDHIYELFTNQILTTGVGPWLLNFPLGNTVTATINQVNPGTITTSRPLADHELFVTVQGANIVTWSDARPSFGYTVSPGQNPANYKLVDTGVANTYQVENALYPTTMDFGIHTETETVELAFYPVSLVASTQPWAQVANGRIKLNKPHNPITDGHQTNINGGTYFPNEYQNNPYYLKGVPSLDTSTYSVFDVYKDSGLTTLYLPADYADPENDSDSPFGATGSGFGGASSTKQTGLNFSSSNPLVTQVMKSNASYPDWNINTGDIVNASFNSVTWIVTSHNAVARTFNDRNSGSTTTNAPSQDDTALISTGNPLAPRFWVLISENSGLLASTNGNTISYGGDSKLNSGQFDITDLGVYGDSESGQLNAFKLFQGPTNMFKTATHGYPLPSLLNIAFEPNPYYLSSIAADIKIDPALLSGLSAKDLIGVNAPNYGYQAVNGYGGNSINVYQTQSGLWDTNAFAPTDYAGSSTFYLEEVSGHPGYFNAFSDFARTTRTLNFDSSLKTASGPTNYVDPAGDDYPTNIDLTATNVAWDIGTITWYDGQEGTLNMINNVNGATTLSQTVYIKNISSTDVEFYTDAALTTAYTSADFTSDWTPFINAGDDGQLQFLTKEPVSQYTKKHPTPGNYSYGYTTAVVYDMGSVTRLTNSTDVFDFNTYAPESGSMVGAPSVISSTNTGVDPYSFETDIDITLPLDDTTTGQVGPDTDEPNPYEIDTVELILPGNETFTYQTGASTTAPGGKVNTSKYWAAGSTTPSYYTSGTTSATFNTTVDTNGYLQNVTLVEEPDAEGRYPTGEDIALFIEALPDTYTAPVLTPAEQADIYDTHDEWTTDGYNALKEWPHHISPAAANIVYNSPTIVNNSQNGIKYTRSSSHTKWVLEVEYPPMSAEDFQKFHAVAQAAHGQSTPFLFSLRNKDDVSILWADMMDTNSSLSGNVITPSAIGDAVLFLEGLTASDSEAFRQGEVFLSSENENGKLHTSIGAAASNAFGEAKVRMPWPLRAPVAQSELVNKNPANCVVTLNSDQFEYSVDVNNYYTVSVAFDLDNWK